MGTPRRALSLSLSLALILATAPALPAMTPGNPDDAESWRNDLAMPPLALPEGTDDALEASYVRPEVQAELSINPLPEPPRPALSPLIHALPQPLTTREAVALGLMVLVPDRLYLLPLGCGGVVFLVAPDPETWIAGQLSLPLGCGLAYLR